MAGDTNRPPASTSAPEGGGPAASPTTGRRGRGESGSRRESRSRGGSRPPHGESSRHSSASEAHASSSYRKVQQQEVIPSTYGALRHLTGAGVIYRGRRPRVLSHLPVEPDEPVESTEEGMRRAAARANRPVSEIIASLAPYAPETPYTRTMTNTNRMPPPPPPPPLLASHIPPPFPVGAEPGPHVPSSSSESRAGGHRRHGSSSNSTSIGGSHSHRHRRSSSSTGSVSDQHVEYKRPRILPMPHRARSFWGPGATSLVPCLADGTIRNDYKRARIEDTARPRRDRTQGRGIDDAMFPRAIKYWTTTHIEQVYVDIQGMPAEQRHQFGDLHKQLRELWFFHDEVSKLLPPPAGEGQPTDMVPIRQAVTATMSSGEGDGETVMVPRNLRDFVLAMNQGLLEQWKPFSRSPGYNVDSVHSFLEDFSCFLYHNDMFEGQTVVLMEAPSAPTWLEQDLHFAWAPFRGYHERQATGLTPKESMDAIRYRQDSEEWERERERAGRGCE